MQRDLLQRLSPDKHLQDPDNWPPVPEELIDPERLSLYQNRKTAIINYCHCEWTLNTIKQKFGFQRKDFQRLLKRCFKPTADGGILGFEALIPYKRIKETNGKLRVLFTRFPELEKFVIKMYGGKTVELAGKKHKESRMAVYTIHEKFLGKCRELGIGPNEFPLNSKTQGKEPLRRYLKKIYLENTDGVLGAREGKEAQQNLRATGVESKRKKLSTRPYAVVQGDAHRADAIITIWAEDPNGLLTSLTLDRPWLLLLIDKASRAILGYLLSLSPEPSNIDFLRCAASAMVPWKPKQLTIEGLKYPTMGGLPSGVLPSCAWRAWDRLELDNAWIHMSPWVQERINLVTQCSFNLGKSRHPTGRAIIERLIQTLEERGFHRLPSTTGSNPKDPRRQNPVEQAKHFHITLSEIEQVLDIIVARHNVTSSKAIYNRTPLDYIRDYDQQKQPFIRTAIEKHRESLPLFYRYVKVKVRGNAKKGKRPYIEYKNAIYKNEALVASFDIIGTLLTLEVNETDVSSVRAHLPDGSSLGLLRAQGRWGLQPHSLKTREVVCKLMADNIISPDSPDPISEYLSQKYQESFRSAKAASALTRTLKESGELIVLNRESEQYKPPKERDWQPRRKKWITLSQTKRR